VETTTLPEDSYLDQDAEILEIFVEEIEEIFVELNALFPEWLLQPDHPEHLKTIRRHFHTLKGSGRMVGAKSAGEMAWAVEDTLNRVLSGSIQLTATVQKFAQAVLNVYQYALYPKFKHVQEIDLDLRPMVLLGQQLQQQISPEPALEELLGLAESLTAEGQMTGLEIADHDPAESVSIPETVDAPVRSDIEETVAIFIEEAEEHLETIATFLRTQDEKSQDYNALIRAIHTLRGSSSMAQIEQIFEASSKVEQLFKTLLQDEIVSTSKEIALLIQYAEFVSDYLHLLRQGDTEKLDTVYATFEHVWQDYGFALTETEAVQTQGLVSKLVELDIDLLLDAEFEFDKRAQVDYPEYIQALSQQAAELLAHTDSRAAKGIHEFTADLKSAYDALLKKPVLLNSDYAYELFAQAHQEFIHLFDTLAAGQRVILNDEIQKTLSELSAFVQQDLEIFAEDAATPGVESSADATPAAETLSTGSVDFAVLSQRIATDRQQRESAATNRDFDEELLSIFLEEADELLAGIDEDLNTWSKKQDDTTSLNNLMRHL
ncbi:MAG: Hpt domain-containing protein, partial [Acinetobacter sp.]